MNCLIRMLMLVLLFSGTVLAHDPGLSSAEIRILPDRIVAEVSFARVDLDQNFGERLLEIKADEEILALRHFDVLTPDANSIHFILEFPNSPASKLHLSAVVLEHLPPQNNAFARHPCAIRSDPQPRVTVFAGGRLDHVVHSVGRWFRQI